MFGCTPVETHTKHHTHAHRHARRPWEPREKLIGSSCKHFGATEQSAWGVAALPNPKESGEQEKCCWVGRKFPEASSSHPGPGRRGEPGSGTYSVDPMARPPLPAARSPRCSGCGRPLVPGLRSGVPRVPETPLRPPLPARLAPAARPALTSGVSEWDIYGKETLNFP